MKRIPTSIHGIIDYVAGLFLIWAPSLLGFNDNPAATLPFTVTGIVVLIYSLFTWYEWGLIRLIPVRWHLLLDKIVGAFLLLSPWLLGFSADIWMPHVGLGLFSIGVASMTRLPLRAVSKRRQGRTHGRLSVH